QAAEGAALEPLVEKPEAVAVPEQQLHAVTTPVQEDEERPVEGIVAEVIADSRDQPIVRLTEVDRCTADEDPDRCGQAQHVRSSAATARRKVSSSKPGRTARRRPFASSTSIRVSFGALSASTSTSTKAGAPGSS